MFRYLLILGLLLFSPLASIAQSEPEPVQKINVPEPTPVGDNMGVLNKFSYKTLFSKLPDVAGGWRIGFIAVGMLIATMATAGALSRASRPEEELRIWINMGLVIVAMVSVPLLLNLLIEFVSGLDEQGTKAYNDVAGTSYTVSDKSSSPIELASRLQNIADTLMVTEFQEPNKEEGDAMAAAANTAAKEDEWELVSMVKSGASALGSGFSFMENPVLLLRKFVVWFTMNILLGLTLCVSSIILVFFETLRFFLLHMGSIVLPVFIAGTITQSFRQQSTNYIFGMIGIVCWPIGWMLLNIGGEALMNAFVEYMNQGITAYTVNPPGDPSAGQQLLVVGEKMQMALAAMPTVYLMQTVVFGLGLALYLIIGTAISAVLIQRMVVSGASFFSPIAAAGMQAAGAAMMMAAPVAAAAGVPGAGAAMSRVGSIMQSSSRYMDDSAPVVQSVGRPTSPGAGILGVNPSKSGGERSSSSAKALKAVTGQ